MNNHTKRAWLPSAPQAGRLIRAGLALAVLALLAGLGAGPYLLAEAPAATFTPNTVADGTDADPGDGICETSPGSGICTLRAAVQEANALPGADQISIPLGTYTLTIAGEGEDAGATGDLDIYDDLTITGAGAGLAVIDANGLDRAIDINGPYSVSLTGVTVRNGAGSLDGGGVYNDGGTLAVSASEISTNILSTPGNGGGLYNNNGAVTIDASTFNDNSAVNGGAIHNTGSSAVVTITLSLLSNNTVTTSGGAVNNVSEARLSVTNTTLSGNSASSGGGLRNTATASLLNVTFSGNSATNGGSLRNTGTVELENTLLSAALGGGVNCAGAGTSLGHNLSSDDSCSSWFTATGDLNNTPPMLDPLGDYGGPTSTHRLQSGSPAADGGSGAACPATDQRGAGYVRPLDGDGDSLPVCDIGAYELETQPTRTPTATATRTPTPTATLAVPTSTRTPTPTPKVGDINVRLPLVVMRHKDYFEGPCEAEDNDTDAMANGPLVLNQSYCGYHDDQKDYFFFTVENTGSLTVSLSLHPSTTAHGVQLQLFRGDALEVNRVGFAPAPPYQLSYSGTTGETFYIYVFTESGFDSVNAYSLTASMP